jgi:hypothetical protein
MRRFRLVLLTVYFLGIAFVLIVAAFRTYLTSPFAAERASAVLSNTFGATVRVGSADIDVSSTILHDVRVFEVDAGPDDLPWADAQEVQTDVTLAEIINHSPMPRQVHLFGARVTLRFDESGHLLTHLPRRKSGERLPVIHIRDSQVTIQQTGRPDLLVQGIEAVMEPESGTLKLTGEAFDPRWGQWSLAGGLDVVRGTSELHIKSSQPVSLSAATLQGLPFVSPKVWQTIRAEGQSTLELTVKYDPNSEAARVRYWVKLEPTETTLDVLPIEFHALHTSGRVLIDNGLVTLENVRGKTGDGDIRLTGELDFRTPPTRMTFDIRVDHVDITQLPKKWPMTKVLDRLEQLRVLEGRLTGHADLVVTVVEGKAKTTGQGKGEVMAVAVGKKATLPLTLTANETGFHFMPGFPSINWGTILPPAGSTH